MKRPVSIFCLADIHFDKNGDMSAVESLCPEFTKFIDGDKNRIKWMPDYIVIAGDVADKNGSYGKAKKLIDRLCAKDTFGITPDRVIIVPGNHDKEAQDTPDVMKKEKETFDKYCKKCDSNAIKEFGDVFKPRFKKYITFSKKYSSKLLHNSSVVDKRLRSLSGVKVFDEDHLCFVCVNTEWLYENGRSKSKVFWGSKDITPFMSVDENCPLCIPLVKDACDLIKNKYRNYTVVTVMHRGFEHLSWKERNTSDVLAVDTIGSLLNISDLIITGHDHVLTPAPPTLIRNHVQHIQLGAVGIKEPKSAVIPRSAEIIRLNVSEGTLEQLMIKYVDNQKNGPIENHWDFVETNIKYNLCSKFLSRDKSITNKFFLRDTVLTAQSSNRVDVERAIRTYFNVSATHTLVVRKANNNLLYTLRSLKNDGAQPQIIVVYYHFTDYMAYLHSNNSPITHYKEKLDIFRDESILEFQSGKIIINEVVVDYPLEIS